MPVTALDVRSLANKRAMDLDWGAVRFVSLNLDHARLGSGSKANLSAPVYSAATRYRSARAMAWLRELTPSLA